MDPLKILKAATRPLLDYALPPRCPACGVIVDTAGAICAPCWVSVDFVGEPICLCCGDDLPGGTGDLSCGSCLASPPPYDRARAVMYYGQVARTVAHRLKYGRRLSLARVIANHMARLMPDLGPSDQAAILVPVPLHRWRIWGRGFNQSAIIAGHLAQRIDVQLEVDLLRRVRATPPLHGLRKQERAKVVQGAFALAPGAKERMNGRHIIVVDDIWTTGATATACARLLRQGGAARVDVICWARVSIADD